MGTHWTAATRSWLASYFLKLTRHFPSLASSRNNQIITHTPASASHSTPRAVVEGSISIGVQEPLPIIDEAACENRSTTSAGSSRVRTSNSTQPCAFHPMDLFREQNLGTVVLGFAITTATGLLFNPYQRLTHLQASAIAIGLCIGVATTWNGMFLHPEYPRVANALEGCGACAILLAFFGLVSSFVPPSLIWVCWLCGGSVFLPFLMYLVRRTAAERSAERQGSGQATNPHATADNNSPPC